MLHPTIQNAVGIKNIFCAMQMTKVMQFIFKIFLYHSKCNEGSKIKVELVTKGISRNNFFSCTV